MNGGFRLHKICSSFSPDLQDEDDGNKVIFPLGPCLFFFFQHHTNVSCALTFLSLCKKLRTVVAHSCLWQTLSFRVRLIWTFSKHLYDFPTWKLLDLPVPTEVSLRIIPRSIRGPQSEIMENVARGFSLFLPWSLNGLNSCIIGTH